MAEGYKDFVAGAGLAAADLEDYGVRQSVMRFASAAARNAALASVLTEGMVAFLKDTNTLTIYSGSNWCTVGPVHGAPTSWTPVVVQGATPSLTVTWATYSRVGREVTVNFQVAITSAGTSATDVSVSLPVTAATGSVGHGSGGIIDTSATLQFSAIAVLASTTTLKFKSTSSASPPTAYLGSADFTAALANGDTVYGSFSYVAAADA